MFHDYPGNIRELENIIEYAFVLCAERNIAIHCLPENIKLTCSRSTAHGPMDALLKSKEAKVILDALERNKK